MGPKNTDEDVDEQYKLLWDYAQEVRRANPRSNVILGVDDSSGEHRFDKMYICLGPVKEGFLTGCRPLVGDDECYLKGHIRVRCCQRMGLI
ncbi:hypothetical protein ACS0TY_011717 [Phlomoides rotata]